MARVEVVKLAEPIDLHGRRLTEVRVKEPTGFLYSKIGEPRILVSTPAGGAYYVEQASEIAQYMEAAIDHETGADLLRLLGLEDAREVKATLLGFFDQADERRLKKRLTRSSSE